MLRRNRRNPSLDLNRLRVGWLPAALLLLVIAPESRPAEALRTVEVTASRFEFNPSVLEVHEGERVRLVVRSVDVTHGLAIKQYDVKVKIPKGGEAVTIEFVADRPGTFRFACSEYCGSGHRRMKGRLVVKPKAE